MTEEETKLFHEWKEANLKYEEALAALAASEETVREQKVTVAKLGRGAKRAFEKLEEVSFGKEPDYYPERYFDFELEDMDIA